MRKTLIAVATTVALAACSGGDESPVRGETDASTPPATETTGATPIDGTWSAPQVTNREASAAIKAEGFETADFLAFFDEVGASRSFDLTLKFQDGAFTLLLGADGAVPGLIDLGNYTVEDGTLTYSYTSGCGSDCGTSTLRWTVEGDRLTLELLEDDQGLTLGRPSAIWVTGLYTSQPFERTAS
jgi:hypothetical protein